MDSMIFRSGGSYEVNGGKKIFPFRKNSLGN